MRTALAIAIFCLLAAVAANCAFINPPVLHQELRYSLTAGSSYADRGSAYWKNTVYLSGWPADTPTDPIYAIDVSDPNNMRFIGRSGSNGGTVYYFNSLFPYEDKLYVGGWGDMLRDYSIPSSTPGNLTFLGDWDRPCEPDGSGGQICYFGWGIRVIDDRAYVSEASERSKGLYIIDVSNPSAPTEVSRLEPGEGCGVPAVKGSFMYFSYNHYGSVPEANYFAIKIANISDETNPYIVNTINLTGYGSVGDIQIRGNIAYVVNGGIATFDISDPVNPVPIGRWNYGTGGQMLLLDDYAFLATGGNGCQFVNIANPANMYVVYAVYHGSPREYEDAVVGNGRYVYIGTTSNKLVQDPPYNVLHSFEVFTTDPDNAGPGNCKEFSPAEASWENQYNVDTAPRAANPVWNLASGDSEAGLSVISGILRINDTGVDDTRYWQNWEATNTRGCTVVFKAKCDSYNLNGQVVQQMANVFIEDGRFQESFVILPNKVRASGINMEAAVDGTQWHTYRITFKGTEFNLYIDENPTPAITGLLYGLTSRSRITFGTGTGSAMQDVSFDYLHYYTNGAFPPSPLLNSASADIGVKISEIAGKGSMSGIDPATARVYWSTDEGSSWQSSALSSSLWDLHYGGTVLPSAATPAWKVAEGSETYGAIEPGVVHIVDNSTASGSKIKWSRAWGVTPSMGATVLVKAKCPSAGGDTSLLGNIYIDDGIKSEMFRITPTKIDAVGANKTCNLDATQWHTYRITMRNSMFRLYIDESTTPAMNTAMVSATNGAGSRVMFGSGASLATQSIYFDYVRYTIDNEYLPGSGPTASDLAVACDARDADDRCYLSAGALPLSYSRTKNKVKFSLNDKKGNIGFSPVYTLRILSSVAPQPVTNFTATTGAGGITLHWTNPSDQWFTGTAIRYKTSGYPTGPYDGTLLCDRTTTPGAADNVTHTGLGNSTYYYAAFAHDETPNYASPALASAIPGCVAVWVHDDFESYPIGGLGTQGGWSTVSGSAGLQVCQYGSGGGEGIVADTIASGGVSVASQQSFNSRSGGYHYLSFDVSQDAAGTTGQELGYVSFQSSQGSEIGRLHVQKGRLLLEYGTGQYAIISTAASNLTYYNVKFGFNVDNRTIDTFLDGVSKSTGSGWKGSATDFGKIVIGSDRNANLTPQKMYIDNLLGEAKPGQTAQVRDDGAWTPSLTKLHFSFDPADCAGEYRYAIGTTSGGTQTRNWTSCGQATDVTATGLSLSETPTYYVSIQVGTGYNTWGVSRTSDGIKVAPAIGILAAKALADGGANDVKALRGKLVSGALNGYFYVQEPDAHQGMKAVSSSFVSVGDQVDICGVMKGSGAERYLDCTGYPALKSTGPGGPYPVAMSTYALGGVALNANTPGVTGGIGPNNVGLLVCLFGKVTQRQTTAPMYFYVDDGCGLRDGTTTGGVENLGVRILADPTSYAEGTYVTLQGVVSSFNASGLRPQIPPVQIQTLGE